MSRRSESKYMCPTSYLSAYTADGKYVSCSLRCYHEGTNNKHKEKQRLQWARTGDGLPGSHQRFLLLNRKICSKAICKLVGFSPCVYLLSFYTLFDCHSGSCLMLLLLVNRLFTTQPERLQPGLAHRVRIAA